MDANRHAATATPSDAGVFQALLLIGRALGHRYAYWHAGAYHFIVADEWTIALTAETAGRFRLEACYRGDVRTTLWALASDRGRLASIVVLMVSEVHGALTA